MANKPATVNQLRVDRSKLSFSKQSNNISSQADLSPLHHVFKHHPSLLSYVENDYLNKIKKKKPVEINESPTKRVLNEPVKRQREGSSNGKNFIKRDSSFNRLKYESRSPSKSATVSVRNESVHLQKPKIAPNLILKKHESILTYKGKLKPLGNNKQNYSSLNKNPVLPHIKSDKNQNVKNDFNPSFIENTKADLCENHELLTATDGEDGNTKSESLVDSNIEKDHLIVKDSKSSRLNDRNALSSPKIHNYDREHYPAGIADSKTLSEILTNTRNMEQLNSKDLFFFMKVGSIKNYNNVSLSDMDKVLPKMRVHLHRNKSKSKETRVPEENNMSDRGNEIENSEISETRIKTKSNQNKNEGIKFEPLFWDCSIKLKLKSELNKSGKCSMTSTCLTNRSDETKMLLSQSDMSIEKTNESATSTSFLKSDRKSKKSLKIEESDNSIVSMSDSNKPSYIIEMYRDSEHSSASSKRKHKRSSLLRSKDNKSEQSSYKDTSRSGSSKYRHKHQSEMSEVRNSESTTQDLTIKSDYNSDCLSTENNLNENYQCDPSNVASELTLLNQQLENKNSIRNVINDLELENNLKKSSNENTNSIYSETKSETVTEKVKERGLSYHNKIGTSFSDINISTSNLNNFSNRSQNKLSLENYGNQSELNCKAQPTHTNDRNENYDVIRDDIPSKECVPNLQNNKSNFINGSNEILQDIEVKSLGFDSGIKEKQTFIEAAIARLEDEECVDKKQSESSLKCKIDGSSTDSGRINVEENGDCLQVSETNNPNLITKTDTIPSEIKDVELDQEHENDEVHKIPISLSNISISSHVSTRESSTIEKNNDLDQTNEIYIDDNQSNDVKTNDLFDNHETSNVEKNKKSNTNVNQTTVSVSQEHENLVYLAEKCGDLNEIVAAEKEELPVTPILENKLVNEHALKTQNTLLTFPSDSQLKKFNHDLLEPTKVLSNEEYLAVSEDDKDKKTPEEVCHNGDSKKHSLSEIHFVSENFHADNSDEVYQNNSNSTAIQNFKNHVDDNISLEGLVPVVKTGEANTEAVLENKNSKPLIKNEIISNIFEESTLKADKIENSENCEGGEDENENKLEEKDSINYLKQTTSNELFKAGLDENEGLNGMPVNLENTTEADHKQVDDEFIESDISEKCLDSAEEESLMQDNNNEIKQLSETSIAEIDKKLSKDNMIQDINSYVDSNEVSLQNLQFKNEEVEGNDYKTDFLQQNITLDVIPDNFNSNEGVNHDPTNFENRSDNKIDIDNLKLQVNGNYDLEEDPVLTSVSSSDSLVSGGYKMERYPPNGCVIDGITRFENSFKSSLIDIHKDENEILNVDSWLLGRAIDVDNFNILQLAENTSEHSKSDPDLLNKLKPSDETNLDDESINEINPEITLGTRTNTFTSIKEIKPLPKKSSDFFLRKEINYVGLRDKHVLVNRNLVLEEMQYITGDSYSDIFEETAYLEEVINNDTQTSIQNLERQVDENQILPAAFDLSNVNNYAKDQLLVESPIDEQVILNDRKNISSTDLSIENKIKLIFINETKLKESISEDININDCSPASEEVQKDIFPSKSEEVKLNLSSSDVNCNLKTINTLSEEKSKLASDSNVNRDSLLANINNDFDSEKAQSYTVMPEEKFSMEENENENLDLSPKLECNRKQLEDSSDDGGRIKGDENKSNLAETLRYCELNGIVLKKLESEIHDDQNVDSVILDNEVVNREFTETTDERATDLPNVFSNSSLNIQQELNEEICEEVEQFEKCSENGEPSNIVSSNEHDMKYCDFDREMRDISQIEIKNAIDSENRFQQAQALSDILIDQKQTETANSQFKLGDTGCLEKESVTSVNYLKDATSEEMAALDVVIKNDQLETVKSEIIITTAVNEFEINETNFIKIPSESCLYYVKRNKINSLSSLYNTSKKMIDLNDDKNYFKNEIDEYEIENKIASAREIDDENYADSKVMITKESSSKLSTQMDINALNDINLEYNIKSLLDCSIDNLASSLRSRISNKSLSEETKIKSYIDQRIDSQTMNNQIIDESLKDFEEDYEDGLENENNKTTTSFECNKISSNYNNLNQTTEVLAQKLEEIDTELNSSTSMISKQGSNTSLKSFSMMPLGADGLPDGDADQLCRSQESLLSQNNSTVSIAGSVQSDTDMIEKDENFLPSALSNAQINANYSYPENYLPYDETISKIAVVLDGGNLFEKEHYTNESKIESNKSSEEAISSLSTKEFHENSKIFDDDVYLNSAKDEFLNSSISENQILTKNYSKKCTGSIENIISLKNLATEENIGIDSIKINNFEHQKLNDTSIVPSKAALNNQHIVYETENATGNHQNIDMITNGYLDNNSCCNLENSDSQTNNIIDDHIVERTNSQIKEEVSNLLHIPEETDLEEDPILKTSSESCISDCSGDMNRNKSVEFKKASSETKIQKASSENISRKGSQLSTVSFGSKMSKLANNGDNFCNNHEEELLLIKSECKIKYLKHMATDEMTALNTINNKTAFLVDSIRLTQSEVSINNYMKKNNTTSSDLCLNKKRSPHELKYERISEHISKENVENRANDSIDHISYSNLVTDKIVNGHNNSASLEEENKLEDNNTSGKVSPETSLSTENTDVSDNESKTKYFKKNNKKIILSPVNDSETSISSSTNVITNASASQNKTLDSHNNSENKIKSKNNKRIENNNLKKAFIENVCAIQEKLFNELSLVKSYSYPLVNIKYKNICMLKSLVFSFEYLNPSLNKPESANSSKKQSKNNNEVYTEAEKHYYSTYPNYELLLKENRLNNSTPIETTNNKQSEVNDASKELCESDIYEKSFKNYNPHYAAHIPINSFTYDFNKKQQILYNPNIVSNNMKLKNTIDCVHHQINDHKSTTDESSSTIYFSTKDDNTTDEKVCFKKKKTKKHDFELFNASYCLIKNLYILGKKSKKKRLKN